MRSLLFLLPLVFAAPALAQQTASRVCYVVCDPADPRTLDGLNVCDDAAPPVGRAVVPRPVAARAPSAAPRRHDGRAASTEALARRAPRAAAVHSRRAR